MLSGKRLTKADREHALDLLAKGMAQTDVAAELGCSQPTISRLITRNRWQRARGLPVDAPVPMAEMPTREPKPEPDPEDDWLA